VNSLFTKLFADGDSSWGTTSPGSIQHFPNMSTGAFASTRSRVRCSPALGGQAVAKDGIGAAVLPAAQAADCSSRAAHKDSAS